MSIRWFRCYPRVCWRCLKNPKALFLFSGTKTCTMSCIVPIEYKTQLKYETRRRGFRDNKISSAQMWTRHVEVLVVIQKKAPSSAQEVINLSPRYDLAEGIVRMETLLSTSTKIFCHTLRRFQSSSTCGSSKCGWAIWVMISWRRSFSRTILIRGTKRFARVGMLFHQYILSFYFMVFLETTIDAPAPLGRVFWQHSLHHSVLSMMLDPWLWLAKESYDQNLQNKQRAEYFTASCSHLNLEWLRDRMETMSSHITRFIPQFTDMTKDGILDLGITQEGSEQ